MGIGVSGTDSGLYWIQCSLFISTILVIFGYLLGLFKTTILDAFDRKNRHIELSHIVPLMSFIFLIPFILSISVSIDDFSLFAARRLVAQLGAVSDGQMGLSTTLTAIAIMLSYYIFIWAFCRSFYIISLLDAGIWSEMSTFGQVLGAAPYFKKIVESLLRGAIICMFLNHQILIADSLGADFTEFYGMKPASGCDFSLISFDPLKNWLSSVKPGVSGQPVFCGAVNTFASSSNEIIGVKHGAGPAFDDASFYQLKMVAISAFLVLICICVWSFYTGRLYKRHNSSAVYISAKKQFYEQRFACVAAAIPVLFMYIIACTPPSLSLLIWTFVLTIAVIGSSVFFLYVVFKQVLIGVFGRQIKAEIVVGN